MQLTVENISSTQRLVKVTVPSEDLQKVYDAQVRKTMKTARMDGFRKGHVPANIIESQYGKQILEKLMSDFIGQSISSAEKENKIAIVGHPKVKIEKLQKGEDLAYELTVDVFPEFEVKPLDALNIDVVKSEVKDGDVDKMIEVLRNQQATWKNNDTLGAQKDNLLYIDFTAKDGDKEVTKGKNYEFPLVIGRNSPYPGFDDQLIGHKTGDSVSFRLKLPEDFHDKDIAGKEIDFEVKIKSVSEKILPEVDDRFIAKFGVKDGKLSTLKTELAKNMNRELIKAVHAANSQNVFNALLEQYGEFEIPESLQEQEMGFLKQRIKQQYTQAGIKEDQIPDDFLTDTMKEQLDAEAAKRARFQVILYNIAREKDFKGPTPEQINEECRLMAQAYENSEEVAAQIKKNRELFQNVFSQAYDKSFVQFVIDNAKTTEVPKTFSELFPNDFAGA